MGGAEPARFGGEGHAGPRGRKRYTHAATLSLFAIPIALDSRRVLNRPQRHSPFSNVQPASKSSAHLRAEDERI